MTNIENYITGETIAQTIRMVRSAQPVRRPVVLAEGGSDRRVFRNLLRNRADVVPGNGKTTTLDSLNHLDVSECAKWLIVIVDADFDRILGVKHHELVLQTDSHDLDCEHIRSPALTKAVVELCSKAKCSKVFALDLNDKDDEVAEAIRKSLLEIAYPIGVMRLVSIQNDYRLAFKKIDHSATLNRRELSINIDSLVNIVLSAGAKSGTTGDLLKSHLTAPENAIHDPWQICQGHDLNKFFVIAIKKYWGVGNLSEDEIERNLRLAYEAEFFWQTNLGKELLSRFEIMKGNEIN